MTPQDPLRRPEPDRYPGWLSVEEALSAVPEPEPAPRRFGCSVAVLVLILALSSSVPRVAGHDKTGVQRPGPAVSTFDTTLVAGPSSRPAIVAEPTQEVGTQIYTASATWCAPTPTKCTDWGGNARLAAVNSFTWGDEPYPVRVWRGDQYVDAVVVSHCACQGEDGYIDLSPAAFAVLAPLGLGRIDVAVEVFVDLPPHPDDDRMRVEDGGPTLPATDSL